MTVKLKNPTTFVAFGYGVEKKGTVDVINQVDIAPYVVHLLGLDYQFPDGKLPMELLKQIVM